MTDSPSPISMINSNERKRKQLPKNNLFHKHQGNLLTPSDSPLPIITLSPYSNFKEKIMRTASNHKSPTPTDFRMAQIRSHIRSLTRSNMAVMPRSSLNYPTTNARRLNHHQQQQPRSHRTPNPSIPVQKKQTIPPPPHTDYGHFLAYLRRQSLVRQRRKQEVEDGNSDHIETTITLNLNKSSSASSPPTILSTSSYYSLTSLIADTSSIPTISLATKRSTRPATSYRLPQRPLTTYRQTPLITDHQLFHIPSSPMMTPTNSVVDDETMSPIIKPNEFYLNNDMLHHCYINGEHGRHLLSSAV